jgi:cytochrome c oxidase subunit 1
MAVHPPERVPSSLNGFGLWNILVAVLMFVAYGYPIAQFFIDPPPQAVIHRLN